MIWQFTITDSTNTDTIVDEPLGFTEMTYSVRRNLNHHGVFKSINTGSLKYVNDAFGILNTEYETNGADAQSTLKIEYKCVQDDEFTTFFEGKFDFNTFNKICGKMCYIECQVIVSSCVDTFLSGVDSNIDLDAVTSLNGDTISPIDTQTLYIDGQDIILTNKCNNDNLDDSINTNCVLGVGSTLNHLILPILFPQTPQNDFGVFNANGISPAMIQKDLDAKLPWDNTTTPVSITPSDWEDYMQFTSIYEPVTMGLDCQDPIATELNLNGTISITPQFLCGLNDTFLVYKIYNSTNDEFITHSFITIPSSVSIAPGNTANFTFNINATTGIDLNADEVLCLFFQFRFQSNSVVSCADIEIIVDYDGTNNFSMVANSSCPTTSTKSYKLNDVFNWMPNAINNCFDVTCNADCFPAYQLTNGLMIRNVTNPVLPKLFVSWTDLFRNITKIFNIGWGFTNNDTELLIGDLSELYTNTPVLDLGSIAEVKFEHAKDLTFGLVNVGYSKWEAEEYSGLDEMNTARQYKRNITSNSNQMDLISNFITAGYTIEITRRKNMPLTGTSDWRYDNDIFLINTDYDGTNYRAYRGVDYDPINIISPTTRMNYRLTPIRTLLNWFKSIVAPTPDFTTAELQFASGTGNYEAHGKMLNDCSLELTPLTENETIISSYFNDEDLAKPLWKAIYASFTCPLTIADKGTIDADPYGTFTFTCNGIEHNGYLVECTYTPENGTANFKILLKNE